MSKIPKHFLNNFRDFLAVMIKKIPEYQFESPSLDILEFLIQNLWQLTPRKITQRI